MKYQFQIDGRAFGAPIRDKWEDAAQDAVSAGYGFWVQDNDIVKLDTNNGATILRIRDK